MDTVLIIDSTHCFRNRPSLRVITSIGKVDDIGFIFMHAHTNFFLERKVYNCDKNRPYLISRASSKNANELMRISLSLALTLA